MLLPNITWVPAPNALPVIVIPMAADPTTGVPCDWDNVDVSGMRVAFVTHSLGSRILFDSLNELLGDDNRRAIGDTLANLRTLSADLAAEAKPTLMAAATLLRNLDQSYSDPGGLREGLTAGIADFDKLAKNLNETNHQLQLTVQDARPGLRGFSQRTLSDVGELVAEARQLISGVSRLVAGLDRDPSRVLFGDRRKGYQPQ